MLGSVASDLNGIYTESYLGNGDPTDSNGFNDSTIGQKFINSYNNNGGEAKIGYPINYVHKWGDYWVQDFRLPVSDTSGFGNSIIIYNPTKNAVYLLHGAIWAVYESISGVNSRLGLPISNEESFPVCDNRLNMIQRFANGYITRLPGESYYKEYVYTDDTQDPSVTITFPTNGSTISGKDKYIAASATDNIYARKIILYLDGKLVGILNPSQICSQFTTVPFDTTQYPNGTYTLVAEAYDMSERVGKSQISVTVSNSAASGGNNAPDIPQALYQYKSDGVAGIGAGEPTNERTVVMKGNVFDADGGSVSLEVEVKAVGTTFDGNILSNCVPDNPNPANSGGTAVVRCSNLADGQYKWRARSKDDKGVYGGWNEAGGNADTAADFIVSAGTAVVNTPPTVTLIYPTSGETLTLNSSYTIKWSAIDDTGTIDKVEIYLSTNGGVSWSPNPINSNTTNMGTYTWTPTSTTTQGRIKVVATDSGGAQGVAVNSGNFSIVSSCAKPSTPTLNSISPYGNSYTVSWSASSGATNYILQQDTSSSFTNPTNVYSSNGTSWYSGEKANGTYYYRVKATNSCGDSSWSGTQSATIQVNQAPGTITALSPADGATNQSLNNITLSWSATHPGGESLRYNVYVTRGNTNDFFTSNIKSYGQTATSFTVSNLPYNETISWGIEAIDDTGDTSRATFHFTTIGDSAAPTGSISINNGSSSTDTYGVTLNLSASDSGSGVTHMRLSNDGVNWTLWDYYSPTYAWNIADERYGGKSGQTTYTVYAKFKDQQGNESAVYSDTINKATGKPGNIILNGSYYETIQDAINAANLGDTVYLTEGTYQVVGTYDATRFPSYPNIGIVMRPGVRLMGAGSSKTFLEMTNGNYAVVDADNAVIEGLRITNSSSSGWKRGVLMESIGSKIKNCVIKGNSNGIEITVLSSGGPSNIEVSNNEIVGNTGSGIWISGSSNPTVLLYNNTIVGNNSSGVSGWSNTTIVNNIIANNLVGIAGAPVIQNNDIYNNWNGVLCNYQLDGGSCNSPDKTGINGNISSDPSFVNSSGGDYRLNPASPVMDKGVNVGIPYNGSAPDMGAYEYLGTGTIQVTSNRTDAAFSITGPSGTYTGSGVSWSQSGLPIGIYTITFTPIANLYSPPHQSKMLYTGQTLTFDGTYPADNVPPTGKISVNFDEYAAADNLVALTFDLTDEIAGISAGSQMMFSNDGSTWSTAETYSSIKKEWDLMLYGGNTTSGTKTVYAKVSDLLGNWTTLTDTILYVPNRQVLEVPTQYSTIQSAIDAAQDGDTVYVLPGTYSENLTLKAGVRLQGAGATLTFLTRTSSNPMIIIAANNSMIDGFTIGKTGGNPSISCSSASPIISNNVIYGLYGVKLSGGSSPVIRNNIIQTSSIGIQTSSIGLYAVAGTLDINVLVENNTFSSTSTSSTSGIHIQNARQNTKVWAKNNIMINSEAGIKDDNSSDVTHQHVFSSFNTFYNNTNNFSGYAKIGPGDATADPMFVDSANGDYHLKAGSSSIGSGDLDARYNDPDGTRNDRGAYGGPSLNTTPKADFSISALTAVSGTTFTLDAGLSHDGESKDEKLQVRWDFDGDGTYDTGFAVDKVTTHTYDTIGDFNVTLQVKDEKGYLSTATKAASVVNQPPNIPATSIPADGSTAGIVPILSWSGGDPDYSDTVTYDVYFGTSSNPPLISSGQTETYFSLGTLSYGSVYYWRLVATDNHGAVTTGPVWYFVTEQPDTSSPTGSISISNDATNTNSTSVTLSLFASDDRGTVSEMQFSNDGTTWSGWENYSTPKTWILPSGDGQKTVYVQFKDAAGNVSNTYSDTIMLDSTLSSIFSSTSPIADSYINSAVVGYTLTQEVVGGTIIFERTGGAADSATHVYNFTFSDLTAGTHSINTGLALVNGAIYTVTFEATDLTGNATSASNTNITYDTTSASVTIASPSSSSVTNNAKVSYILSKDISAGEIVFTRTGGMADGMSPYTYAPSSTERKAGSHTVNTNQSLMSGTVYTVSIQNITDEAGNATASVSNTGVMYDATSVAITNTTPAANAIISAASAGYTLSEQAQNGKITFTWSGGKADGSSPHVYTMTASDLTAGSHTMGV